MVGFVKRYVHDYSLAESLTYDAIQKGMEQVEISQPNPTKLKAWLYSIVLNLARQWKRNETSHEMALRKQSVRSARDSFSEAISREALQLFDHELQRLTKMQRKILLLRIIDRLSFDEIGLKLNLRSGAARAIMHRARAKLRRWLGYMRAL